VSILLVVTVRSSQQREMTKQLPWNLQHVFDVEINQPFSPIYIWFVSVLFKTLPPIFNFCTTFVNL